MKRSVCKACKSEGSGFVTCLLQIGDAGPYQPPNQDWICITSNFALAMAGHFLRYDLHDQAEVQAASGATLKFSCTC